MFIVPLSGANRFYRELVVRGFLYVGALIGHGKTKQDRQVISAGGSAFEGLSGSGSVIFSLRILKIDRVGIKNK
jgi:hypothetical protein